MENMIKLIGQLLTAFLGWTGEVATALTSSSGALYSLLPFFLLGVAVSVSMIVWKIIRRLCWGA